jgi:hypothetical protein
MMAKLTVVGLVWGLILGFAVEPALAKKQSPGLSGTSTCMDGSGDATYDANGNLADLTKVVVTARRGKLGIEWTTTGPVVSDPRGWWITISNPPPTKGVYQIGLTVKNGRLSEVVIDVTDSGAEQRTTLDRHSLNGADTTLTVPLGALSKLRTHAEWRADVTAGFRSDGDLCSGPDGAFLPLPS